MVVTERCRECLYFCSCNGHYVCPTCDYFLITGKRRGCPAGDNCDKFLASKECLKINTAANGVIRLPVRVKDMQDLYEQGKNDVEIARAVGVSRATVAHWRAKNGLISQYDLKRMVQNED